MNGAGAIDWEKLRARASGGLYVTDDHSLRLTTFNAASGVTLALEGSLLGVDGRVVSIAERHVPNTNRSSASSVYPLAEGWLTSFSLRASGGTPTLGQCYAIVELVRGRTGAIVIEAVLAQGYITDTRRRGFPYSPLETSSAGDGAIRSIAGTNPAAGAEVSETVPTGARWELITFTAQLVTSATVANRLARIEIDDGTTVFFRGPIGVNQAASTTYRYFWSAAGPYVGSTDTLAQMSFFPPKLQLAAGYRLRTVTTSIQAGDQYSAIQYLVREWIEGG